MSEWMRLSSASSRTEHSCSTRGERGCRGCRWFETRLYSRDSEDGIEYKLEMIGKSVVDGEVDRIRVETTTSANAVVDFLALGDPGNRYIPKVSRKILHEAADEDQAIADAIDDFDTITAP